ncbi:acyl-CoA dehydrogenase/oxidase [Syncephalis plumigaleata]|nr:acyl-CoA dehydrogenase/oxidase [Syncephalis plumigaleata]
MHTNIYSAFLVRILTLYRFHLQSYLILLSILYLSDKVSSFTTAMPPFNNNNNKSTSTIMDVISANATSYLPPLTRKWEEHPDLARERSLASFTSRQLTHIINGGQEKTEHIESIRRLVEREILFDKASQYHLNHEQLYVRGLQIMERFKELQRKHKLSVHDIAIAYKELYEGMPTLLNDDLFIKTIMEQASDEQKAVWLPLARNWGILGCYAQTEMAHGSNVRGIETTAAFIPDTDEIELNTPTLSSVKWWPGALGKTANVAVVMAQLILPDGSRAGVFPFMVQLRSFANHTLLPGVETGDIGPKIGFNAIDNGYLSLKRVRIPRKNMFMRRVELTRDGVLKRHGGNDQRHVYGTLLYARVNIVADAMLALAYGTTITTRYSLVRRQFSHADSSKNAVEVPILNHQSQQLRVIVPICEAYAFHFTGKRMKRMYKRLTSSTLSPEAAKALLAESHASASALKTYVTDTTSGSLETLRRACGGHGYSKLSGMPDLLTFYLQFNTGDGENHVMAQQAARVLLKRYTYLHSTPNAARSVSIDERYMLLALNGQLDHNRCTAATLEELRNPRVYLHAFEQCAAYHLASIHRRHVQGAPFSDCHIDVERLVRAHAELYVVRSFVNSGESAYDIIPPPIHQVLSRLCDLFALSRIQAHLGDHLEAGYLQPTHGSLARAAVRRLLQEIRPDALALVDAFNVSDRSLGSALGRWDGRVYEALAAMAQAGPMNRTDVTPGYEPAAGALAIDGQPYKGLKGIFEAGWHHAGYDRIPARL